VCCAVAPGREREREGKRRACCEQRGRHAWEGDARIALASAGLRLGIRSGGEVRSGGAPRFGDRLDWVRISSHFLSLLLLRIARAPLHVGPGFSNLLQSVIGYLLLPTTTVWGSRRKYLRCPFLLLTLGKCIFGGTYYLPWTLPDFVGTTLIKGHFALEARAMTMKIVRAQKKVSKGRPNTPPQSCNSVVTDP
jgi:hypothetical protein